MGTDHWTKAIKKRKVYVLHSRYLMVFHLMRQGKEKIYLDMQTLTFISCLILIWTGSLLELQDS